MRQPVINPPIAENQVLVNALLEHYDIRIDPDKCASLIFDMNFAEMLSDGTLKKTDRESPEQQLDSLDCFRYMLNTNYKWFLKERMVAA